MEYSAALIVILICGALGLFFISLNRNLPERIFLTRLFLSAFGIRLVFTFAFYALGIVNILGGADDTGWAGMWATSRYWETSGPGSMWDAVYGPSAINNQGFQYFGSWFYYLLGMESQIALACLNGFINAMTVLVIYKTAREFFSHSAASFVSRVAVFLPAFLVWSALTVKEPWVIFFAITTFYAVYKVSLCNNKFYSNLCNYAIIILLIGLMYGFRFYAAGILLGGTIVSFLFWRVQSPLRAAGLAVVSVLLLFGTLSTVGIMPINLAAITQTRLSELAAFRTAVSDSAQSGAMSGVDLGFDTSTTSGALMQLAVGTSYLLLSPFPWQIRSLSQVLALPDVLLWWWLVFGFIIPGTSYSWRRQSALVLSMAGFLLPLIMFYAMMFANVGLVYRQRVQLMPFLFVLAAAGYEKRQREKELLQQNSSNRVRGARPVATHSHS